VTYSLFFSKRNKAMGTTLQILGIAGSLRKQSFNRGLLRAAAEAAPSDCHIEPFDLSKIPLYNQDEEDILPSSVAEFKTKLRAAHAILIVTPEYNHSIPGVLKNAFDWGSRPYGDNSWEKKPVALMGASPSLQGTSRAQLHLRQVFSYLNMFPMNKPEFLVSEAQHKFDENGNLIDEKTREKIKEMLSEFITWIRRF
jgi:chromate reductase, NAD(P)H dehydrogenase (quinone)